MIETKKQFVAFGNFNAIDFDSVLRLSQLKDKYSLHMSAQQEIIPQIGSLQQVPNNTTAFAASRPVFQSSDKNTTVFFGTTRIHIEQVNFDSDMYETFKKTAVDIICEIKEKLDLNYNRLAINGQFWNDEVDYGKKVYRNIFKESMLYNSESEEWQFRIASKDFLQDIGCTINKIVAYSKGTFAFGNNNNKIGLFIGYDYNTEVGIDKTFSIEEICKFSKVAFEYRNKFLN